MTTDLSLEPSSSEPKIKTPSELIDKFFRKNNTHILEKHPLNLDIKIVDDKTKYIVSINGNPNFNSLELEKADLFKFAEEHKKKYGGSINMNFKVSEKTFLQLSKMDRLEKRSLCYPGVFAPLCLVKNLHLNRHVNGQYVIDHAYFVHYSNHIFQYGSSSYLSTKEFSNQLIINLQANQEVSRKYFTNEKNIKELCDKHQIEYKNNINSLNSSETPYRKSTDYIEKCSMIVVVSLLLLGVGTLIFVAGRDDLKKSIDKEHNATMMKFNSEFENYKLSHSCDNNNVKCLVTKIFNNIDNKLKQDNQIGDFILLVGFALVVANSKAKNVINNIIGFLAAAFIHRVLFNSLLNFG